MCFVCDWVENREKRKLTTTLHPRRARSKAYCLPNPLPAPVFKYMFGYDDLFLMAKDVCMQKERRKV